MTRVQQIRKEFGEPFKDIVRDFAQMRYSKRCTALTLGITTSYFNVYLKRYAPDVQFPARKDFNEACIPKGKGYPKGRPRGPEAAYKAWETRRTN